MEKSIRQYTIVDQVMERIKELIASGKYKIGDKLPTEGELAEKFGIGRSSVREAIKIFNYLGILESRTAKGTYVCDRSQISTEALTWAVLLGSDEINELLETRAAIELWSVLQLTTKYKKDPEKNKSYIDQLGQTIERMKEAIKAHDISSAIKHDFKFHEITISSSENSLFKSIYQTLRSFTMSSSTKIYQDNDIFNALPNYHEGLLQAIISKDENAVIHEMQNHISITHDKLYASFKN